jgi:hypothetical protein
MVILGLFGLKINHLATLKWSSMGRTKTSEWMAVRSVLFRQFYVFVVKSAFPANPRFVRFSWFRGTTQKRRAGWPDEYVWIKITQNVAQAIFLSQWTHILNRGKRKTKNVGYFCIFQKRSMAYKHTFGFSPNLVTLAVSHYYLPGL